MKLQYSSAIGAYQAYADQVMASNAHYSRPSHGRASLKHGDIKNLDMPGMTMALTVRYRSQLTMLRPGDKVQFMVVQEGGKMVVTDIQPAH